jgi:hypothetical protein
MREELSQRLGLSEARVQVSRLIRVQVRGVMRGQRTGERGNEGPEYRREG